MPLHVSVQDIQRMHPAPVTSATDSYYAKLANKLLKSIQREPFAKKISGRVLEMMAIKTALYFEDVICDGGIWRSFVTKHKALYGKSLPFYPVDEDDYRADEPHVEDITYLLWETLMDWGRDMLLHPLDEIIAAIAWKFFEVLNTEFEEAPINEAMQEFFREASFMDDFVKMREVLGWVWMDCYLTENHRKFGVTDEMLDEVCQILPLDSSDSRAIYAAVNQMFFKYKCGPLALRPAEWLALLMDAVGNHAYAEMLNQLEYRRYEVYLLEDFDEKNIQLRNTKDEILSVNMDGYGSMDTDTLRNAEGCVSSFVRFNGRWEPNGMDSWGKLRKAYEYAKEQQKRYKVGLPPKNYRQLMNDSGGSPLFYFRNGKEVREFMVKRVGIPEAMMRPNELDDKEFVVAYVPSENESISFAYGVADCIKDVRNPYYGMGNYDDNAMILITDEELCDGAMLRYLIANNMLPDASFSSDPDDAESRKLAQDNLDFLARTVRRENF